MKNRWGRVVSIASVVGLTGNAGQVNYVASKAGLIGMTKSIAHEVGSRGVTCNCVAPGIIVTAMTEALSEEQRGRFLAAIPIGRLGAVEDVAASYVTGQTLHVNGGLAII